MEAEAGSRIGWVLIRVLLDPLKEAVRRCIAERRTQEEGREERHSEVAEAFRKLLEDGGSLVTTNYVLVETSALLQRRIGLDAIRDLESRALPLLKIRWMTELLHRRGMDRLVRTDRRHVSLVDCSSFVMMEDERIRQALALDEDLSREGFGLLPDPEKIRPKGSELQTYHVEDMPVSARYPEPALAADPPPPISPPPSPSRRRRAWPSRSPLLP